MMDMALGGQPRSGSMDELSHEARRLLEDFARVETPSPTQRGRVLQGLEVPPGGKAHSRTERVRTTTWWLVVAIVLTCAIGLIAVFR